MDIKYRIDMVDRYEEIDAVEGQQLFTTEKEAKAIVTAFEATLAVMGQYRSSQVMEPMVVMVEVCNERV